MKIYATTTSERASKGQGGKYIEITLQDEQKDILIRFETVPNKDYPYYSIRIVEGNIDYLQVLKNQLAFFLDNSKGNKKKDEVTCEKCKRGWPKHNCMDNKY